MTTTLEGRRQEKIKRKKTILTQLDWDLGRQHRQTTPLDNRDKKEKKLPWLTTIYHTCSSQQTMTPRP
jgi:hypothetical protein